MRCPLNDPPNRNRTEQSSHKQEGLNHFCRKHIPYHNTSQPKAGLAQGAPPYWRALL